MADDWTSAKPVGRSRLNSIDYERLLIGNLAQEFSFHTVCVELNPNQTPYSPSQSGVSFGFE